MGPCWLMMVLMAGSSVSGQTAITLETPGTATWSQESVGGGVTTRFELTGDTVLSWSSMQVKAADRLVYHFSGGERVVNVLQGVRPHRMDGRVESNGEVWFVSPRADFQVGGEIVAKSVTLASMGWSGEAADGVDRFSGGGMRLLRVTGKVEATDGDVLLVAPVVQVGGGAEVEATGAARVGGATGIEVLPSGNRRLEATGEGLILHLGKSRANSIEWVAGSEVVQAGRVEAGAGAGKIFLEVGAGGRIRQEGTGVMLGDLEVSGVFEEQGVVFQSDDGDTAGGVASTSLKMPEVRRPGGQVVAERRVVTKMVPMTAAVTRQEGKAVGHRELAGRGKDEPVMRRARFFGLRGQQQVSPRGEAVSGQGKSR